MPAAMLKGTYAASTPRPSLSPHAFAKTRVVSAMPTYCCVPLCKQSGYLDTSGAKVSFHRFPRNEDTRKRWMAAIKRDEGPSFQVSMATKVCSKHFVTEDFVPNVASGQRMLRDDAVPSVFSFKKPKRVRSAPRARLPPPAPRPAPSPPQPDLSPQHVPLFPSTPTAHHLVGSEAGKENGAFVFAPIGRIRTAFPSKNATPRQACICSQSSATLSIDKEVFNRPQHCLDGLEEFSHVWLLSVLDRNNRTESGTFAYKSKVRPPRLDGRSVGVFGTRSPHRPCPIGLSLVRLDAVKDGTLHISGVDLVDGTPILDIKPYIPEYDAPNQMARDGKTTPPPDGVTTTARCASWISGESSSPSSFGGLRVDFTPSALGDLARFHGRDECHEAECPLCLHHLADGAQARQALTALLSADPRSLHRKNNCSDRLYYCVVDVLHVTAWFDVGRVEVLKVAPLALMDAVSNAADASGSSCS